MISLRRILIIPLLLSLAIFFYYSSEVLRSLRQLQEGIDLSLGLLIAFIFAVILQLAGHILRAHKTRLIFMDIKESSTRFQFRALTIGYLFNTLLPFRLGELVRARIIAASMSISFSLALVLIIFERAIDALILGFIATMLFILVAKGDFWAIGGFALTLVLAGALLIALLGLLAGPERRTRQLLNAISKLFNDRLMTSVRFKAWSVIYGLQRTIIKPELLVKYLLLSVAAWIAYGASVLVIASTFFANSPIIERFIATVTPYFGVSLPAGPANLGTFSASTEQVLGLAPSLNGSLLEFTLTAWIVLVVPTAIIGFALLIFKTRETLWERRPKTGANLATQDKLHRINDISTEMAVFLDNYFSGNTLSTIVHKLELGGQFKLLKYFKGGSDAITILAYQNNKVIVKKIIPIEFEDRLRAQYDWLTNFRSTKGIVQVYEEERRDDYFTIDMSYNEEDVPLFDYIHDHPIGKSKAIFDQTWQVLSANVYKNKRPKFYPENRDAYIQKHIFGCLEMAGVVDPELLRAAEPETIIINGDPYDNLKVILKKIQSHTEAWKDIATYAESTRVHGDVIVDNLLVNNSTEEVLIIDPAPDGNIINGQVFDFAKNMQSLYCGYEFLLRDESTVYLRDDNKIDYSEASSVQYAKLCEYVKNELAPQYLTEAEQKAMLFHAAALFIRRLKHQVYYTPGNALKFYAVGVKTLNDFLAQYD